MATGRPALTKCELQPLCRRASPSLFNGSRVLLRTTSTLGVRVT